MLYLVFLKPIRYIPCQWYMCMTCEMCDWLTDTDTDTWHDSSPIRWWSWDLRYTTAEHPTLRSVSHGTITWDTGSVWRGAPALSWSRVPHHQLSSAQLATMSTVVTYNVPDLPDISTFSQVSCCQVECWHEYFKTWNSSVHGCYAALLLQPLKSCFPWH